MCNPCWITQATGTHSEYVTLIALPRQWLCERALLLRCTFFACLVNFHSCPVSAEGYLDSSCGSPLSVAVQRCSELPRSVSGFVGCTANCLVWHTASRSGVLNTRLPFDAGTYTHPHARTHIHAFLTQGCYKHIVLLCGLYYNTDLIYAPRFVLLWA
jgi:hypothetical protein